MIGTINKKLGDWKLIWERPLTWLGGEITINHDFSQYEWVGIMYTYNISSAGSSAVRYWVEMTYPQNTDAMLYLWAIPNSWITADSTDSYIATRRIDLRSSYIKFSNGWRKKFGSLTAGSTVDSVCAPISIWGR